MAIVCGDERLIEAHRRAVREAFAELEGLAAMQMGQWMARDTTGASSRWLLILAEL